MQDEHRKAVCCGEVEKSGMADHMYKEKGNNLPSRDKVKITNQEDLRISLQVQSRQQVKNKE